MKIEEIHENWDADSNINLGALDLESINIPKLHNKYYKILLSEKMNLIRLNQEMYKILIPKKEYYMGTLSSEELKARNWKPFNLRILKEDLNNYLNSDPELAEIKIKVEVSREKIEFLKSIIDCINKRTFQIRDAIDFLKFKNGLST